MEDVSINLEPQIPSPVNTSDLDLFKFTNAHDPRDAANMLIQGKYVLIVDFYYNGLKILEMLKKKLKKSFQRTNYAKERSFRKSYRRASRHLLVKVKDHRLAVKKSPKIGWLARLYGHLSSFFLPFPDIQGLNSSWQWYINELTIDPLDITLKPFYGIYFPTRFDHLHVLDKWLHQYNGNRSMAYDIGTGSGVISFQLVSHGFEHVISTDINPNSIIGLQEECNRWEYTAQIEPVHGDLFADLDNQADLIVFNPPWMPATRDLQSGIDQAIYYPEDLFSRFFEEAVSRLKPDGRLIILFSNLSQVTHRNVTHPVEDELKLGRFQKDQLWRQKVKSGSNRTRRKNWRKQEKVELWVLKHM